MRFLFVDQIDLLSEHTVRGRVRFGAQSPFRKVCDDGDVIMPGVIGEAMGQLVSWALMERQDFKSRPVYLFSERLDVAGQARPGDVVTLSGEVSRLTDETVVFSATAHADGRLLQTLTNCSNYFMPLDALEDPDEVRARYHSLRSATGAALVNEGAPLDFGIYRHDLKVSDDRRSLVAQCRIPKEAAFYADHFPKEPITPVVILNEMINDAVQTLIAAGAGPRAVPLRVEGIKIKSFVRPGDEFTIEVRRLPSADEAVQSFDAAIKKDGKPILRGRYTFANAAPSGQPL